MASDYYVTGYATPEGVTGRAGVRAIQQQLNAQGAGLKEDGIWGPRTEAAYRAAYGGGGGGYAQQQAALLNEFYQALLPMASAPAISYRPRDTAALRGELAAYLRPGYENAMDAREAATVADNAALDADAWARGMGRSTYVTDVKQRAYADEQRDIARLESEYAAALAGLLAEAADAEQERMLEVEQYNATLRAQAGQTALSLAQGMYGDAMAQQRAAAAGSARAGGKSRRGAGSADVEQLLAAMTPLERSAVYGGATEQYRKYRDEILDAVGAARYYALQGQYPGA